MTLEDYQKVNTSYKKTLVFHFGAFAGFYSEYNNMLKAIAFCLVNRIRFVLYSKDARFCNGGGWRDFFLPFTEEVSDDIHHLLNERTPKKATQTAFIHVFIKRTIKRFLGKDTAPVSFSVYDSLIRNRFTKWRLGFHYFTYDLWEDFVHISLKKQVCIKGVFSGSYQELIRGVHGMIWRYNETTQRFVDSAINRLSMPSIFVGMHIRAGDKKIEASLVNWRDYVEKALSADCRNWFVFTDDFTIIEEIREQYSNYSVYSLCSMEERGYYHDQVMREDTEIRTDRIIRMFASVDLLTKSLVFIGTETSNPFFLIEIVRRGNGCISLDSKWGRYDDS